MQHGIIIGSIAFIVFIFGAGLWLYQRPIPLLQAQTLHIETPKTVAVALPWPAYGQASFGADGYGILASSGSSSPAPIASLAKAITALAILKAKPLTSGQTGPLITVTETDVQSYKDYLAQEGSVLPVNVGEQISEYQALQAMMLPSANNIADTAVRWAFGSVESYVAYANQLAKTLGMSQTRVADASGFSAQTTSTAKDLVWLAQAVLKNAVLADIVSQSQANFPAVGTINNLNSLLGTDGISGIKTGNSDQAGGCFMFAAKREISGQPVTVVGAVLGAPVREQAMSDSRRLIEAADQGFELTSAVRANQVVARYNLPWGGRAEAIANRDLKLLSWRGQPLKVSTTLDKLSFPSPQNKIVGTAKISNSDVVKPVPVKLKQPIGSPPWTWRIFH